jgi:hypothetical protein
MCTKCVGSSGRIKGVTLGSLVEVVKVCGRRSWTTMRDDEERVEAFSELTRLVKDTILLSAEN